MRLTLFKSTILLAVLFPLIYGIGGSTTLNPWIARHDFSRGASLVFGNQVVLISFHTNLPGDINYGMVFNGTRYTDNQSVNYQLGNYTVYPFAPAGGCGPGYCYFQNWTTTRGLTAANQFSWSTIINVKGSGNLTANFAYAPNTIGVESILLAGLTSLLILSVRIMRRRITLLSVCQARTGMQPSIRIQLHRQGTQSLCKVSHLLLIWCYFALIRPV